MKLPQLSLRDLFWLVLVCGLGLGWWLNSREWSERWNEREASHLAETQRLLENLFIEQLVKGGPSEKMVAADNLRRLDCKRAVPFLLAEMRERYPRSEFRYTQTGKEVVINVYPDGSRAPDVDYHSPLFRAMGVLAVPYTGPDAKWYELLDRWIEETLPANERDAKITWTEVYKRKANYGGRPWLPTDLQPNTTRL